MPDGDNHHKRDSLSSSQSQSINRIEELDDANLQHITPSGKVDNERDPEEVSP